MANSFLVREAHESDSNSIFDLIKELALFEKAPLEVTNTAANFLEHGWGKNPLFKTWVAIVKGNIVGFALCYTRYSTWKGPVLYLEDLYIKEPFRKMGIGNALIQKCLLHCKQYNFAHLSLQVLDWNTPAIEFYKKYTHTLDSEWINVKIVAE